MKCVICHEGFAEEGDLIKHFALIHQESVKHWDEETSEIFKKLELSLKTRENKRPRFKCSKCDFSLVKMKQLESHVATHEKNSNQAVLGDQDFRVHEQKNPSSVKNDDSYEFSEESESYVHERKMPALELETSVHEGKMPSEELESDVHEETVPAEDLEYADHETCLIWGSGSRALFNAHMGACGGIAQKSEIDQPPYKLQTAILRRSVIENKNILCINSKPYVFHELSELMVTLPDLVQRLYPDMTIEKGIETFQRDNTGIPLYEGNK